MTFKFIRYSTLKFISVFALTNTMKSPSSDLNPIVVFLLEVEIPKLIKFRNDGNLNAINPFVKTLI